MIKKKLRIFTFFLVLTLIPFAVCVDFDGDGIDDGAQNLCGDSFCQAEETVISCPSDCTGVSSGEPALNSPTTNLPPISSPEEQTDIPSNPEVVPSTSEQTDIPLGEQNNISSTTIPSINEQTTEESFFSGIIFKIILGVIGLIVIGLIIFILIKNMKKSSLDNNSIVDNSVANNPIQQEVVKANAPDLTYHPLDEGTNSQ